MSPTYVYTGTHFEMMCVSQKKSQKTSNRIHSTENNDNDNWMTYVRYSTGTHVSKIVEQYPMGLYCSVVMYQFILVMYYEEENYVHKNYSGTILY